MHVEIGLNKPYWIQGQSENWMAVEGCLVKLVVVRHGVFWLEDRKEMALWGRSIRCIQMAEHV